jgi:hypothetical protein
MTKERAFATKLVELSGGQKISPLPFNVDNKGYDGSERFDEIPVWNDLSWDVKTSRELVQPLCKRYGITPEEAIRDNRNMASTTSNAVNNDENDNNNDDDNDNNNNNNNNIINNNEKNNNNDDLKKRQA